METESVIHSTFVIERHYPVAPERVFTALAEPDRKRRWFAEVRGLGMQQFDMDFQVGGIERSSFRLTSGPFSGGIVANRTTYLDIVDNRRIVIAYSMAMDGRRFSASLATFELLPDETGTRLVFTEQGAYFESSDGPQMRQEGWRKHLENLAAELAG
ncbi:MAG: SRPBCC family protein [Bryobacteraceae bacterium]|jgi:uncharacterized protein YndB with AHSA1/START domain